MSLPGLNHHLGEDIDALRDSVRTTLAVSPTSISSKVWFSIMLVSAMAYFSRI